MTVIIFLLPLIFYLIARANLEKRGLSDKFNITLGISYTVSLSLVTIAFLLSVIPLPRFITQSDMHILLKLVHIFYTSKILIFFFVLLPYFLTGLISAVYLIAGRFIKPTPDELKIKKSRKFFHAMSKYFIIIIIGLLLLLLLIMTDTHGGNISR